MTHESRHLRWLADQLRGKIEERREALLRLGHERDRLQGEIAAYEHMLIVAEADEAEKVKVDDSP